MLQRVRIITPGSIGIVVAIDLPQGTFEASSATPLCPTGIYQFTGERTGLGTDKLDVICQNTGKGMSSFWVDDKGISSDVQSARLGQTPAMIQTNVRHRHNGNAPQGQAESVFTSRCCPVTSLINQTGAHQNKAGCVNCQVVHRRTHIIHRGHPVFAPRGKTFPQASQA